jgi:phosphoglycolate phosphatase-like HAD superfamily hydrolase
LAITKSGFDKNMSIVYEDSKNGILSAKSANVLCVGIYTQGLNDLAVKEADYIINDYSELLDIN